MTQPLIADDDADLAGWQSGSQATFLAMASAEVTKFCGWHIAPEVTYTDKRLYVGERGLVMLKSTHVTEITSVVMDGVTLTADTDYSWDEPKGWLRVHPQSLPSNWGHVPSVLVSYTSGFDETPSDVKAVVFEMMTTSIELPASNAIEIEATQYRFKLNESIGVALSDNQKDRLGAYRLRSFGGQVRP